MPKLRPSEKIAREELLARGFIRCTGCDTEKPVSEFHKDRTRWSGYQNKCAECMARYLKGYAHDEAAIRRRRTERAELAKRDLKQCGTCKYLKNRDSFSRRSDSPDGLHTSCRTCTSASARSSRRARAEADPFDLRLRNGYRRATEAGVSAECFSSAEVFDYWESHQIDPWECVWTGERLTPETVQWDHLIPLSHPESPGHVVYNLVPASASANSAKGRKHFVEFLADRAEKRPPVVLP